MERTWRADEDGTAKMDREWMDRAQLSKDSHASC